MPLPFPSHILEPARIKTTHLPKLCRTPGPIQGIETSLDNIPSAHLPVYIRLINIISKRGDDRFVVLFVKKRGLSPPKTRRGMN